MAEIERPADAEPLFNPQGRVGGVVIEDRQERRRQGDPIRRSPSIGRLRGPEHEYRGSSVFRASLRQIKLPTQICCLVNAFVHNIQIVSCEIGWATTSHSPTARDMSLSVAASPEERLVCPI